MFRYKLALAVSVLLMGAAVAPTQTQVTNFGNYIASSYSVGSLTLGGQAFSVSVNAVYPLNVPATSFVTQAQWATDVKALYTAYPAPQDPPEAILLSLVNGLKKKYPQLNAAMLTASASVVDPTTFKSSLSYLTVSATNQSAGSSKITLQQILDRSRGESAAR